MEVGTVDTRAGTGSRTIADLLPLAAEKYGDQDIAATYLMSAAASD